MLTYFDIQSGFYTKTKPPSKLGDKDQWRIDKQSQWYKMTKEEYKTNLTILNSKPPIKNSPSAIFLFQKILEEKDLPNSSYKFITRRLNKK